MSGTLDDYLLLVKQMFEGAQGYLLAHLISLRDEHILNENMSGASAKIKEVVDKCIPQFKDIVISHMYCVQALNDGNLSLAYHHQSECVANVAKLLQSQTNVNWSLPVMFTACLDLRQIAKKADAISNTRHSRNKYQQMATESLLACFRVCASDKNPSFRTTKKLGMLYLANQLFKIYFRIDNMQLCKPLIRVMDTSPYKQLYSMAQKVTFRYFSGRKAVYDAEYRYANGELTFAYKNCHKDSFKNKRLILMYWVPVKMILGSMPSRAFLEKYNLMLYWPLVSAVKDGKLKMIDEILEEHRRFFKKFGLYATIEKLKLIAQRNLFRKIYLLEKQSQVGQPTCHVIQIKKLQAALQVAYNKDINFEHAQSVTARLVYHNMIRGYISYRYGLLVVSLIDAFPKLSSPYVNLG